MDTVATRLSASWLLKHSGTRALRDGVIIAALSVLVFIISSRFDIFSTVVTWLAHHDTYGVHESFTVAIFLCAALLVFAWRRREEFLAQEIKRRHAEAETAALRPRLEHALTEVRLLSGLLPICAWCKKIRDDTGYWNQLESYIQEHSSASFTHGICPECADRLQRKGEENRAKRISHNT